MEGDFFCIWIGVESALNVLALEGPCRDECVLVVIGCCIDSCGIDLAQCVGCLLQKITRTRIKFDLWVHHD
jgi:hypothetical protein